LLFDVNSKAGVNGPSRFNHVGSLANWAVISNSDVVLCEFKRLNRFAAIAGTHLNAGIGDNLPQLLSGNAELKKWVTDFFLKEKALRAPSATSVHPYSLLCP